MAKEIKERFKISKRILAQGYGANIPKEQGSNDVDKFIVVRGEFKVEPNDNGQPKRAFIEGSVFDPVARQNTGKKYFEDLTPFQVHILSHAHVIELTDEQAKYQRENFKIK